jgi:hypothetical protein
MVLRKVFLPNIYTVKRLNEPGQKLVGGWWVTFIFLIASFEKIM